MLKAASPPARPARTPRRAGRRPSSPTSQAATLASWACRCTRQRSSFAHSASRHRKREMQQDILINWSPQEPRVAVVENGAVQELHVKRTLERGLVGNVYLG